MIDLNAEFLYLLQDFECEESYDYFLLGVEYAARISAEIARSQTSAERAIRGKFHLDDDPTHCYVCDRPADDCACELDPNGALPQSACMSRDERLEMAERQIERQRENS